MRVEELRHAFVFDGLTDEQLRDLITVGEVVPFASGEIMFREGEPADFWWVLLDGTVDLLRRDGREEIVANVMERPGVWAGGFRAWHDSAGYLSTGRGSVPGHLFRVRAEDLRERAIIWFPLGVHFIEGVYQTVRKMEEFSRQRAALIALGTLAAGLAHEINNPASAAARAVDALHDTCDTMLSSLVRLAEESFAAEQFVALDALRREIDVSTASADPVTIADREEVVLDWLEANAVDGGWRIAPTFAAAGVDVEWCERAAQLLDPLTISSGFEWVASTLSTTALLSEVKEAMARVSALVASVKSYSQLDRASVQVIDVTEGIESTLVMLAHKLRGGITVERDYAADAPRIEANAAELNQVWTNLIDNAVDAMDGQGTLRVTTRPDGDGVVVEIADTGGGMPPHVQAHAFDPFYTTKDVGKGTGLGLDISRRIVVEGHRGHIDITSRPGETVFSVRLPARHAGSQ